MMSSNTNKKLAVEAKLLNNMKTLNSTLQSMSLTQNSRTTSRRKRVRRSNRLSQVEHMPGATFQVAPSVANNIRKRLSTSRTLTKEGTAFLKCAFAPPDFASNSVVGLPDDFRGPSLVKKHRLTYSYPFVKDFDYYFLLLPTPGAAFWALSKPVGVSPTNTDVWNPAFYSDFTTLFGSAPTQNGDIVTKFRYVSNHFELIPTVNQMVWSGSIQNWKIPVNLVIRSGASLADLYTVTGLSGSQSALANQYSGPFINGVYTGCYTGSSVFDFSPILEGIDKLPTTIGVGDFGQLDSLGVGIPGLDTHFQSSVIKVTGVTANQTALIKTWSCVEYQVMPTSGLYEYQTMSNHDPVALELYRNIISELPVGVTYMENAAFWDRVLKIIKRITALGSYIPGPVGTISSGIGMVTEGIEGLF